MTSTRNRSTVPDMRDVVFFINSDLPEDEARTQRALLTRAGAKEWDPPADWQAQCMERHSAGPSSSQAEKTQLPLGFRFDPELVTHVITRTISFPEYDLCGDPQADGLAEERDPCLATVVSPEWVTRSEVLGTRQGERYFSPDPARIFSGIVVHISHLDKPETELILSAVQSLGGHYRLNLTKEVTHVITPSEASMALRSLRKPENRRLGIVAVSPAWVNECIKFNALLPVESFAWPLDREGPPAFLCTAQRPPFADLDTGAALQPPATPARRERTLLPLLPQSKELETAFGPAEKGRATMFQRKDVLQGLKILFLAGEVSDSSLSMVRQSVLDHGGSWVAPPEKGELPAAVMESDVVVTSFRDSEAGMWALHLGKRLATSSWLWYVIAYGRLLEPVDHVLHFPPPKAPIPNFKGYNFTLSNYTGEARAYLKELLRRAGASWTPEMSIKNTHLLTASLSGEKYNRASMWDIKVVNHTWLEDCIVTWSECPIEASKAYTYFPPNVKLQDLVGHARLDSDVLRPWILQAHEWVETQTHAAYEPEVSIAPREHNDKAPEPRKQPPTAGEKEVEAQTREAEHSAEEDTTPQKQEPPRKPARGKKAQAKATPSRAPASEPLTNPVSAEQNTPIPPARRGKRPLAEMDETVDLSGASPAAEPVSSKKGRKKPEPPSSKKKETRKKDPNSGGTSGRRARESLSETSSVVATPVRGKKRPRADPSSSQAETPARVGKRYYTTTSVELDAADEKQLRKLGWWKQGDVTDHTEVLVAKSLQRTPKLLCAVARGVDVVTPDWVTDMVKSGEPLEPAEYALKDQKNEKLRKMSLSTSLERARDSDGGLLAGHTFLFTPKVAPSEDVLRSVVLAAGGKAPKRSLNVDHILPYPGEVHVISSEADRRLWEQLSDDVCVDGSHVQVWTGELILDGVLRQELQWDKHKLMG